MDEHIRVNRPSRMTEYLSQFTFKFNFELETDFCCMSNLWTSLGVATSERVRERHPARNNNHRRMLVRLAGSRP